MAAGDWQLCGERFYERTVLHHLDWDVALDDMRVSSGRYAGPIALLRDDRKLVRVAPGGDARAMVRTYTAAGARLAEFEWDGGVVAGMAWTDDEDLCVVGSSGTARLFAPLDDEPPRSFALGADAFRDGVARVAFHGTGLVALTGAGGLVSAEGVGSAAPRVAPLSPPPAGDITALAVLPPLPGTTSGARALVAVGSRIAACDALGTTVVATLPPGSSIAFLAVSACAGFVAAVTDDGRVTVWAADFGRALSEFTTAADMAPTATAWCGADAVALLWPDLVLIVGPYGDWVRYDVTGGAALVEEVDGVRVVAAGEHALLRRVPDELATILRPGSTAAAAALADARKALDAGDAAGAAGLRGVPRRALPRAAAACAAAAATSLRPRQQADLLKAAVMGVSFALGGGTDEGGDGDAAAPDDDDAHLPDPTAGLSLADATRTAATIVATTIARLRVLRAAREAGVGVPLTAAQAAVLGDDALVGRLARRGHHLLALRAAAALGVPAGPVAAHWAAAVIAAPASAGLPDAALAARITARLDGVPGVRYGALASTAASAGRRALAADLLAAEPDAGERVPLLLRLGDGPRALSAALASGDPDLIAHVLDAVGDDPGVAAAARASRAAAAVAAEAGMNALLMPAAAANARAVKAVNDAAAAALRAVDARRAGGARAERDAAAASAAALDEAAAALPAGSLRATLATEGAALRRLQLALEASTGHAMLAGRSAAGTAAALLSVGDEAAALQVKTKAGLSDRRFAWLRVHHHVDAKAWDALDAFAGDRRRCPLPLDEVAAAAKSAGAPPGVLAKLVARMADGPGKAATLASLGLARRPSSAGAAAAAAGLGARVAGLVEGGTGALMSQFGWGGGGGSARQQ